MMPSRRAVATALESVDDFRDPAVDLEQYLTPPELAAHVCHLAAMRDDIGDARTVVDLGCGTGMLSLGARLVGAETVVGVDVDGDALATAAENERRLFDDEPVEWVQADATRAPLCRTRATILSNPPFGAQRGSRHADRSFLETIRTTATVSYTIHNDGSREFVEAFAADHDAAVTDAFASSIRVDRRFDFHDEERASIPVEVYRVEWATP